MQVDYIRKFLQTNYECQKIAALQAHAEDGRLSFQSCCCFIGIPTANHALRGKETMIYADPDHAHLDRARLLPFAKDAEIQFDQLGETDAERRERLLPIIRAEMERRETEKLKEMSVTGELAEV